MPGLTPLASAASALLGLLVATGASDTLVGPERVLHGGLRRFAQAIAGPRPCGFKGAPAERVRESGATEPVGALEGMRVSACQKALLGGG